MIKYPDTAPLPFVHWDGVWGYYYDITNKRRLRHVWYGDRVEQALQSVQSIVKTPHYYGTNKREASKND